MAATKNVCCVQGPAVGYTREVLLFRPDDAASAGWHLPDLETVRRLLEMQGLAPLSSKELADFGERKMMPLGEDSVRVFAVMLDKERLQALRSSFVPLPRTAFLLSTFREITSRASETDWQTLAVVTYLFLHLEKWS